MGTVFDFSIQRGYSDREATAVIFDAYGLGLNWRITDQPIEGTVPIGSVEFCMPLSTFRVEFFPGCFDPYFNRPRKWTLGGFQLEADAFVKDLKSWKTAWETRLYRRGEWIPRGFWLLTDPVKMLNEWRYYVVEGDVITTGWYRGEDEEKPAPNIKFPKEYTGAADFAETPSGIELVESHAPFACGWYGENHIDYVYWQYFAWNTQFRA